MKQYLKKSNLRRNSLWLVTLSLCVLGMFFVSSCKKTTAPEKETTEKPKAKRGEPAKVVLRSSLAGRWYSDNAQALNEQIAGFFNKAKVETKDNVIH